MKHPTLYKQDSTGKIRTWYIEQQGNKYWTVAGVQNGEQVKSKPTVCQGKNIGRANETSAEEQATAEVTAKYTKKQKGDYHVSVKNVEQTRFIAPMLAKKWKDYAFRVTFPGWIQPKLNGARCIAQRDGLSSRKGEKWVSSPHIMEDLKPLFDAFPNAILDGELYCDKFAHDLGSTMSLIRKLKPTAQDLAASAKVVQYHVFDIITDGSTLQTDSKFSERFLTLIELYKKYFKKSRVKLVPTFLGESVDNVMAKAQEFISQGFEGLIFRADTRYVFKRTENVLKYKEFQDQEFKVIRIEEGVGNRAGMCGAFVLENDPTQIAKGADKEFRLAPTGNMQYFQDIFVNQHNYIGKLATAKFQCWTPITAKGGGVPFHGNVIAIREDL